MLVCSGRLPLVPNSRARRLTAPAATGMFDRRLTWPLHKPACQTNHSAVPGERACQEIRSAWFYQMLPTAQNDVRVILMRMRTCSRSHNVPYRKQRPLLCTDICRSVAGMERYSMHFNGSWLSRSRVPTTAARKTCVKFQRIRPDAFTFRLQCLGLERAVPHALMQLLSVLPGVCMNNNL